MKKFFVFLLLVGVVEAQQYRGQQNTSFSAVSTAPTINLTASGVNWHNIIWTTSGTVSTCSVQVDSSADGVTWSAGGVITSQICTSNGNSTYVNVVASYIRVNLTVLTGGGSVNVTWTGYGANPQSSGGSVTQVATSSPITGGTITTTGTVACATCVTASSPGTGVAHFAGSTQAVTSSAVALASDVSGQLPIGNVGSAGLSATSPVAIASTGAITCTTCLTTSNAPGIFPLGANTSGQAQNTTNWYAVAQAGSSSEANALIPAPVAMTVSNLQCVTAGSVASGQTAVFTLRAGTPGNMSSTSLTCTITGTAQACGDTTAAHAVALTAGEMFDLQLALSATSGTVVPHCTVQTQ